ncbi:SWIM zinc finger family protein [Actinocrispum wychmicini]|uniref:SWIM zinc finger family protein n=1 Tax=Actinocrispum wychmicini TaxID=1213861 RepID=UPI00104AC9C6|nr:SWIM zinc finger family protein [Actinocrispum wychmicini]
MAVRLDADTVSSLVGPDLARIGREHLDQGRVFELAPEDGGVAAVVLDSARAEFDVWVGVVNGELTGECDCTEDGPLCGHAVAVTLAALEDGLSFTSLSQPDDEDDEERFAEIAATLTFDQLVDLVARQAVADPDFADELLALAEPEESSDQGAGSV